MAKLSANGKEIARVFAHRKLEDVHYEARASVRDNGMVLLQTRCMGPVAPGRWSGWKRLGRVPKDADAFRAETLTRNHLAKRGWVMH